MLALLMEMESRRCSGRSFRVEPKTAELSGCSLHEANANDTLSTSHIYFCIICTTEFILSNSSNRSFKMSPMATTEHPTYSIACIPADGIGPEVIDAGVEVLQALSDAAGTFSFKFENYDWSSKTFLETGKYIPDGGLESLKKHNAILFGAVGAPGQYICTVPIGMADNQ